MPITFNGWAGDFGGQVPGRKPMQALIALNSVGDPSLYSIFQFVNEKGDDQAVFEVKAMMEGAALRSAGLEFLGAGLLGVAIEMLPGGAQLPPGPNLIHIVVSNQVFEPDQALQWHSSTFATIIVPPKAPGQVKAPAPKKSSGAPSRRGS
jgi:hypothetical protein